MKRLVLVLAVSAALFCPTAALAQEEAGVPEEIVKELAYLVGTWKCEGKFADVEVASTVSYSWAKGEEKYGLIEHWTTKVNGATISAVSLLGWNSANKCFVESGFNSAGGCSVTHWVVKSPTQWEGEYSHVIGGEKVEGRGVVVKKGPAEFVYEGENSTGETGRIVCRKVAKPRKPAKAEK